MYTTCATFMCCIYFHDVNGCYCTVLNIHSSTFKHLFYDRMSVYSTYMCVDFKDLRTIPPGPRIITRYDDSWSYTVLYVVHT